MDTNLQLELRPILNNIISIPSEDNPCFAYTGAINIATSQLAGFASKLYQIVRLLPVAFGESDQVRAARRKTANDKIADILDNLPPAWQISEVAVLYAPTRVYQSAYSLKWLHQLVSKLESNCIAERVIESILTELLESNFFISKTCNFDADIGLGIFDNDAAPPPYRASTPTAPVLSPTAAPRGAVSSATGATAEQVAADINQADLLDELGTKVSNQLHPNGASGGPKTPKPTLRMDVLTGICTTTPKFSGCDDTKVTEWFENLEAKFKLYDISIDNKRAILEITTEKTARDIIRRSVTENPTIGYKSLKQSLIDAFSANEDPNKYWLRLQTRSMRPSESLQSYAQDVVHLCSKAEEAMPETRQISYILQGLPIDIQKELKQKNFQTVKELVQTVETIMQANSRIAHLEAVRVLQDARVNNILSTASAAAPAAPALAPDAVKKLTSSVDRLAELLSQQAPVSVNAVGSSSNGTAPVQTSNLPPSGQQNSGGQQRKSRGRGRYNNNNQGNNNNSNNQGNWNNNNSNNQGNWSSNNNNNNQGNWNGNGQRNNQGNGNRNNKGMIPADQVFNLLSMLTQSNQAPAQNPQPTQSSNRATFPRFQQVNALHNQVVCALCGHNDHDISTCSQNFQ